MGRVLKRSLPKNEGYWIERSCISRISHEPERCMDKAFQSEDVEYTLLRGLNNAVHVLLWPAFGEEFI
jgi:hypothetical protein